MSLLKIFSNPEAIKAQKSLAVKHQGAVKKIVELGLADEKQKQILDHIRDSFIDKMKVLRAESVDLNVDIVPAKKAALAEKAEPAKADKKTPAAAPKKDAPKKNAAKKDKEDFLG